MHINYNFYYEIVRNKWFKTHPVPGGLFKSCILVKTARADTVARLSHQAWAQLGRRLRLGKAVKQWQRGFS